MHHNFAICGGFQECNFCEWRGCAVFYCALPSEIFPKIRKYAAGMMSVFASTYICEQMLSFLLLIEQVLFQVNKQMSISI
jgi:hypothetical protein